MKRSCQTHHNLTIIKTQFFLNIITLSSREKYLKVINKYYIYQVVKNIYYFKAFLKSQDKGHFAVMPIWA